MFDDAGQDFLVVRNDDLQFSIWPADVALPAGWSCAGPVGRKPDCLGYIAATWSDMRPLSMREDQGAGPT